MDIEQATYRQLYLDSLPLSELASKPNANTDEGDQQMKTRTIKEISQLLEELDTSFWGSVTLRIQKGELVNIVKEQSIKIDALAQDMHHK